MNLIHLRGKIHDKFSGMKKQGNFTHILHHLNYYRLFIYGIIFHANYEISLIFFFLGVDNWGVLYTHLVDACPDFNWSSDACRKKWNSLYNDYKADYTANNIFDNQRSSRSKFYSLIDGYMHECANVMKHVHGGLDDDDPNTEPQEDQEDL